MARQIVLVFLVAALAVAHAADYTTCGGAAELVDVEVEDCPTGSGRCQFVKGRSYKVTVHANAKSVATELPYTATATILGIPIRLFEGNACESLSNGSCPTSDGMLVTFEKSVEITNTYPALQSTLRVIVNDQASTLQLCADIPFAIVNA